MKQLHEGVKRRTQELIKLKDTYSSSHHAKSRNTTDIAMNLDA